VKVLTYPHPFLTDDGHQEIVNLSLDELIFEMKITLDNLKGRGLASRQVGSKHRVILVYKPVMFKEDELIVMINPTIIAKTRDFQNSHEGCLSVPGVYGNVKRHSIIRVSYTDVNGKERDITATGLYANALQHEIDHLDGILFIDKISKKEYKNSKKLLRSLEKKFTE